MFTFPQARYTLLEQPTPLAPLARLEKRLGRSGLFIKRDDHMPIALGGNKLRSLEFWLGAALEEGADVLLVAGAPVSNQCRLTAAAAAIAGLDCVIIHNDAETAQSLRSSYLNRIFGAEVRFVGSISEESRAVRIEEIAEELRAVGRRPYIVGSAVIGALGYAMAALELLTQVRESGSPIRHVILPGSMGPTEAGFTFGNALLGHPFDVHLVSVEYGQADLAARIARIFGELQHFVGASEVQLDDARIHYHMDYLGPGYALPTPEGENAILTLARTEGILLEHTYTAKPFAGFMDMATDGSIDPSEGLCFLHTGGVPTLFVQDQLFQTI
ncbi:pyridoxal-phosphate dependent enzyme [Nitratireductor pacificus]|uniref:D-cysteine desulfhydrase n=1 Tax=Nitratireductor pacificus pht-3B TaxID=391937 RepID=K2MM49_9HYPH|nr:pyridoxal-phosphate dependent enzyme [Nitratireductor pacificus]EKF18307.1 D-cysteine desulfhydrase [Nitratireductor pacificus pht-3B]